MHLDHSLLVPSMGLQPPPPPHQPLPPSVLKHRGDQLDIPSTKKSKGLDEASAYQLEYQHYQSLMYAHCAQQQRMAAAGQMSAFRPWPQPKSFMHAAYNAAAVAALSTLPYLSQEPPVLQNPERVVRSTDRERFERTYQPNVALAPRKTHLAQEREKEQRELRERERMEREREREMERMRERERERERSREREREFERERDLRERERELQQKHQLQQQQLQQQQQQLKQHQQVSALCEGAADIQIKQERAPTPTEMTSPTPPPLSQHSDEGRRSSNGAPSSLDDEVTTPMISPLSLGRSNKVALSSSHNHNHLDLQARRLSLQNSNSSNSSASSTTTTTPTNLASTPPAQKPHQPPAPQNMQRGVGGVLPPSANPCYMRQSPSPNRRCNSATCTNPARSPEEFGGSNEITSSTSPLPQQKQQTTQPHNNNAQTIIATVNHHNKLLPTSSATFGANCSNSSNNELPGRIRISKNLINQNNIMRSPTPPLPLPPHHHQVHGPSPPQPGSQATAAQNHHHNQQQYDYYKQSQQRFYQQNHVQQQHHAQPHHQRPRNLSPQPPQNRNSPSQSSSANERPAGLSLSTQNATSAAALAATPMDAINASHHEPTGHGCMKQPHLRITGPQGTAAYMSQQQQRHHHHQQPQQQQQHPHHQHHQSGHSHHNHLPNGRMAASMSCEFELSTDTDEDSVHDGEPDSSNTLTPWELAIEALRDSRPKERERLLGMLQRILNENQHYRLQNQQLKELMEIRNEQIAKLQTELQHCQRQLGMLQISQQQHQQQQQSGVMLNSGSITGSNGLITKALRKETDDHHHHNHHLQQQQLILRVPLKKSQRREPDNLERDFRQTSERPSEEEKREKGEQQERDRDGNRNTLSNSRLENCFQPLRQIKKELSESMEADEEDDEMDGRRTPPNEERSPQNVESSQNEEESQRAEGQPNHESSSESEQEDDEGDTKMSSSPLKMSATRSQCDENSLNKSLNFQHKECSMDSDENEEREGVHAGDDSQTGEQSQQEVKSLGYVKDTCDEQEQEEVNVNNDPDEDENEENNDNDEEEEEEEEEEKVQAPHSNALNTPPTATTPLSPNSAATAGQLFDSSNSSDESSMKKAQMSASNALAKMNSETNDDDEEEEEEEEEGDDDDDEEEDDEDVENNDNEDQDIGARRRVEDDDSLQSQHTKDLNSNHRTEAEVESSEGEEELKMPTQQQQRHFHLESTPYNASHNNTNTNNNNSTNSNNNNTNNTTTTVVLATKASKKLTPTTNNDIKIKQEYL